MVTATLESHDIILSDGSTTIGLILIADKSGTVLRRYPAPPLAPQQFQTLGKEAFIPQQEAPFSVKTNHAGFGKDVYETNRYQAAYGTDASKKNRIVLSPVITAMTNSNPTQTGYNMGFENWTAISAVNYLDNWAFLFHAQGFPQGQKDTTVFQAGAASLRLYGQTTDTFRHPLGVTAVNGSIFTLTIYARATTSDFVFTTKLFDGAETQLATQTNTATAGAGWQQKTFTYTFTGTVTNPILQVAFVSGTLDEAWIDTGNIAWTGTAVTALTVGVPVKQVDFNNNHYMVSDTGVWKLSGANWTWVGGSPPGITDAFVSGGGTYLVLCRGSSLVIWLMQTNESFLIVRGTGAGSKAQHGVSAAGKTYLSLNDNTVYQFSTDGVLSTSTISTTYTAGQTGYKITSMVNHLEIVYAIKENGVFYIPATGTVMTEVAYELRNMFNTNTGKNAVSWRGNGAQALYVPAGSTSQILAYDAGDVVSMGPVDFAESLSDFTGQVVATASDDQWLYIILDNGTKVEGFKGRYEKIDGVTDFRWHHFFEDTYGTVTYAAISSIGGTETLYYGGGAALPKYLSLAGSSYATGGTHITSTIDLGLPNILKNFRSLALRSKTLSANVTVKVEYKLDGETNWTELGGSGNGTYSTSPFQEKFFGTSANGVNSRTIQLRFTLATNSTSVTPEIIDFTLNYVLNPPLLDIIECDATVSDENRLISTGEIDREMTYAVVSAQLRSWETTIPLTLTIPDGLFTATGGYHDGVALLVHFAPGYPYETVLGDEQDLSVKGRVVKFFRSHFARNRPVKQQQKSVFNLRWYQLRSS